MKLVFLSIYLFVISINIHAQDYFRTNFEAAKKEAIQHDKPLFVSFSTTWCTPCKYMEKEVFPDSTIRKFLTRDYINVKLYKKDNEDLFQQFEITTYPTYIVLNKKHLEIDRFSGSLSAQALLKHFTIFYDRLKFERDFESNKSNLEFLYNYYNTLILAEQTTQAKAVADHILSISKSWLEIPNMYIVANHLYDTTYRTFYLKHISEFTNKLDSTEFHPTVLSYYFSQYYDIYKELDSVPVSKIQNDFILFFGESNYINPYHKFLISVLQNKEQYQQLYQSSFIHLVNNKSNLFTSPFYYDDLSKLIQGLEKRKEIENLYKGIKYQLTFENSVINYYDLKAFVEYRLDLKEEIVRTMAKTESISQKEYAGAFESELQWLIDTLKNE